jgi:hypothetical protein
VGTEKQLMQQMRLPKQGVDDTILS